MVRQGMGAVLIVACLALFACDVSPSAPSGPVKPPSPPALEVACVTSPAFRCTATVYGEGDVTAKAAWSAAESFRLGMDLPVTASPAVEFESPGVATALRPQNVYIRADYVSARWGAMRNIAPHAYAVDPGGAAVPLAYLSGTVFSGGIPGNGVVGGVTVAIIDGERTGRQDVTRDNGFYMIEFLHLNTPFTAQASKPGYSSDVRTHPGIVDDALGYPSNTSLHFSLAPAQ